MFKLRCLYWLTRPYFKNKRIWLTYDKLYKGGDCGEYFYKYASSRKAEGIEAVYVINKNSPDCERLQKEGFKPLVRGTIKHRLNFLNAEVVFTTHTGVYNFNSFTNDEIISLQDLLKFDVSCIQHGLTVQSLAFDSNRLHNNIKKYYCASKHEIENLSKPIYGYEDAGMLKLTGIPRYDGLIKNDKRQILITPTWRNYIVMPPVMGSTRPYNPHFKETEYFKIYDSVISDERIINHAKMYNYKIIYLLHPVISVQRNDYRISDGVEIISALDVDYEKILTESSLMITDYSGVQFDFAYMRKPVVYYHPDE
ncbi:CDP-glycerol glycerophosphotransferase family protein, partial [Shinella sp. M27]|uniref:CDP-glycerol glycerophosphotransferase family protein n=1 Tax=Shinella sp. M27 TaxID=3368614 RepID=UPI003BA3397D